jgi:hypothetical protein
VIELPGVDARLAQAVIHGLLREPVIMLLPREAFFLGGRDELTIANDARRAVVIERGDTEDVHGRRGRLMPTRDDLMATPTVYAPPHGGPRGIVERCASAARRDRPQRL